MRGANAHPFIADIYSSHTHTHTHTLPRQENTPRILICNSRCASCAVSYAQIQKTHNHVVKFVRPEWASGPKFEKRTLSMGLVAFGWPHTHQSSAHLHVARPTLINIYEMVENDSTAAVNETALHQSVKPKFTFPAAAHHDDRLTCHRTQTCYSRPRINSLRKRPILASAYLSIHIFNSVV